MLKKTSKLLGLFLLLVTSFIYTDKVFSGVRKNDPIMKEVMKYKKDNDKPAKEPVITDDEIILGYSGLVVNAEESYKNMKEKEVFNKKEIVYDDKLPKTSITKNYDYYVKKGNPIKNEVSIIFKVDNGKDLSSLLTLIKKYNIKVNFFVDGTWLEKNIKEAFDVVNLGSSLYNLGYNGKYSKEMIGVTNNIIESVSLKESKYCLNEEKNDEEKKICKRKKMLSITPTIVEPNLIELKKNLTKGAIISYDLNNFDIDELGIIVRTITSRGYKITNLSSVLSEK